MADDVAQQDEPKVVAADALFWRRVPADWVVIDENLGRRRPSSAAFDDDRDGGPMSMYEANAGNSVDDILIGHESYGVASLTGAQLSSMGFKVYARPEPGYPAHVEVEGKKTGGLKSKMAKNCLWVREPA